MIIFRDYISDNQVFNDTFKYKLVDDLYYEVEGKLIPTSIAAISSDMIGSNASAEAINEAAVGSVSDLEIDFVTANGLQQAAHDKASFKRYLISYMNMIKARLQEKNPERVDKFVKGANAKIKTVFENFNDWKMYIGEIYHPTVTVVLVKYREDGTPFGIVWKDGVYEERIET